MQSIYRYMDNNISIKVEIYNFSRQVIQELCPINLFESVKIFLFHDTPPFTLVVRQNINYVHLIL
jgi:hypothetical protein